MIPSARTVMLMFSIVFCIICFSFYIHVCLLIAVGVWIILGSSWTMPGGKPQAAGRYHNVTFSDFHHQLGFVFLFYDPDQRDTLSSCHGHFQLWLTKDMLFLFSFFFSLVKENILISRFQCKYVKHKTLKTQFVCFYTTDLPNDVQ